MASIRKRDGKYQARVVRKGHRPIAKSFINRVDAVRWARHMEVAIEQGATHPHTGKVALSALLLRYKNEVTPTKKNAKSEGYLLDAWIREDLATQFIEQVRPEDLARWRDKRLAGGTASGTIRNALAALSAVFRHTSAEWGFGALTNPVMKLKRPAPGRARSRRVSDEEIVAIKASTKSRELPSIVDLAVESGMRLSEIVGLKWKNIDLNLRTALLTDTKNGDAREVPLSSRAISVLTRRYNTQVVQRMDGRVFAITPHAVTVAFRRAVKRARVMPGGGITREATCSFLAELRFHDLRHEAITRLFEFGLNPIEVASVSGHRTMQMLLRYSHLRATDLAKKLG